MLARQCDRCGALFNSYKHQPQYKLLKIAPTPSRYSKKLDLCLECEKELVEWFEKKKCEDK